MIRARCLGVADGSAAFGPEWTVALGFPMQKPGLRISCEYSCYSMLVGYWQNRIKMNQMIHEVTRPMGLVTGHNAIWFLHHFGITCMLLASWPRQAFVGVVAPES